MVLRAEIGRMQLDCGRTSEAEIQFEKLLGPLHVKSAIAELSRSEKGDDGENVKYSELFYGRHFNGSIVEMLLMDKLGRKVLLSGSFLGMFAENQLGKSTMEVDH
ncbi:hypothetical protein E2562_031919 [Oryza meyeriana var. granulata]|uniref:Uncharacterized protein n=1 Tax=Oryza meyeriana var. granulata TaxID=110450 RepID=A0A6G1DQW5_9ORYZ|nr:hypothetical protein E2562_031919 [Oryza meyeriana var. granulata]